MPPRQAAGQLGHREGDVLVAQRTGALNTPEAIYSTNHALHARLADGSQLDAFGRLRVSAPFSIFDSKQISSNDPYQYEEMLVGTATDTFQYDRSSTFLAVGTALGDRAVRQTKRYFPYVPGKSHSVMATGVFAAAKANLSQYIGYGDDLNGLFFKMQGTTLGVVVRTATSGVAVDNFIAQAQWNIDKLDGTGPSGVTMDISKAQIFLIDFQWLGVGRIRFAFDIDGVITPVHEVMNANNLSVVYMSTPTLPIRYELVNTGITASASTLEQICCAVTSEGGYAVPGSEFTVSNGITRLPVTVRKPILAFRLKTAFPVGKPNRRTARLLDFAASAKTNNAYIEIVHAHGVTAETAAWLPVDDSSGMEYSVNITSITATHAHLVKALTAVAGQGSSSGVVSGSLDNVNAHSFLSQNFGSTSSDIFVMYATAEAGTADVTGTMGFVESE